jgi:hypothetical protein
LDLANGADPSWWRTVDLPVGFPHPESVWPKGDGHGEIGLLGSLGHVHEDAVGEGPARV